MTDPRTFALSVSDLPDKDLQRSPPGSFVSDQAQNGAAQYLSAQAALDVDIARAEAAYQLMVVADACLKNGADRLLLLLGFTQLHVAELRASAGPHGGYPSYALRNIRAHLRHLRRERQSTRWVAK